MSVGPALNIHSSINSCAPFGVNLYACAPGKYGFEFEKEDLYYLPKTKTVKVDTVISNIASFAKGFQTNYKELKLHNAWLRENKLNNKSRKLFKIRIPLRE